METIVLFDPSIRSLNMGDHVIMNSAAYELADIIGDNYVIRCGTHSPAVTFYQNTAHNPRMKVYDNAKYKFICGSNLLWKNMFIPRPTFNINLWNCRPYRGSVLVGVGTNSVKKQPDLYTRKLYDEVLSKKYIHSVRDEETKRLLNDMGYEAINTGCPTMWGFTKAFCETVPTKKACKVIFTLTDYSQDLFHDQKMIDVLQREYSEVYFWVQGVFDLEYFAKMKNTDGIKVVAPTLAAYDKVLRDNDIDYVGTRLHAGMFALQHRRRTFILALDNRVRSMKETYNLNSIERDDVDKLEEEINKSFDTDICISEDRIRDWKSQFV